eukprot:2840562-Rhodomonas_salina.2
MSFHISSSLQQRAKHAYPTCKLSPLSPPERKQLTAEQLSRDMVTGNDTALPGSFCKHLMTES